MKYNLLQVAQNIFANLYLLTNPNQSNGSVNIVLILIRCRFVLFKFSFCSVPVPSAPPSNAKAVGKTSTSCLVSWNEVPKQFQNNLILGYNISYILYQTQDTNYVVVPGQLTNTKEINGLKKFSKYNVTLTAYTDKGMGNDSSVAHLTCETLQDGKS